MSDPDELCMVVTSITITRRYFPDRNQSDHRDTVTVDTEGDPTLVESLGLLEFAKLSILDPGDDDDDE